MPIPPQRMPVTTKLLTKVNLNCQESPKDIRPCSGEKNVVQKDCFSSAPHFAIHIKLTKDAYLTTIHIHVNLGATGCTKTCIGSNFCITIFTPHTQFKLSSVTNKLPSTWARLSYFSERFPPKRPPIILFLSIVYSFFRHTKWKVFIYRVMYKLTAIR